MWYGGVVLCCGLPGWGGGTVSRSGGVRCRPWLVLWRCGAALRGLLVVLLACFSTWAVRGRCCVGPGVPLGRGVPDWSVATRGVWSCGAWWCRPTVEWAQWCGERRVWATRGLLRARGPRVRGSRHLGRVVAPVRRPRVVSGGVWLGCIVSTVGGGAICSGVGWACGRLPAGIGCRGLTVGGSSAVSTWCVPWWSLVGWLKGVFGVYRIHGGTIVCWRAAAGGALA